MRNNEFKVGEATTRILGYRKLNTTTTNTTTTTTTTTTKTTTTTTTTPTTTTTTITTTTTTTNSIQCMFTNVSSQHPDGQLQKQHDTQT